MLTIRRDADIYRDESDGFVLRFHFSFKGFQDPNWNGFGALRLFNDDRKSGVLANRMHRHEDVEVVTYIVEGTFRHEDSLGDSFLLPAGSVECLSAGSGIEHAEHNASATDPLRMILMYFVPETSGLPPSVSHQVFTAADRAERWLPLAGPPGGASRVVIHQQAHLFASSPTPPTRLDRPLADGRGAYLYVVRGQVRLDDQTLSTGDAAAIRSQPGFSVEALGQSELLLVDVPLLDVAPETDAAIKGDVRVTASEA